MFYDQHLQAWVLADGNGKPVFIFFQDGSIGFAKVGPYARIRFNPTGTGLEVSDNTGVWRTIPFSYGTGTPSTAATNGSVTKVDLKK